MGKINWREIVVAEIALSRPTVVSGVLGLTPPSFIILLLLLPSFLPTSLPIDRGSSVESLRPAIARSNRMYGFSGEHSDERSSSCMIHDSAHGLTPLVLSEVGLTLLPILNSHSALCVCLCVCELWRTTSEEDLFLGVGKRIVDAALADRWGFPFWGQVFDWWRIFQAIRIRFGEVSESRILVSCISGSVLRSWSVHLPSTISVSPSVCQTVTVDFGCSLLRLGEELSQIHAYL